MALVIASVQLSIPFFLYGSLRNYVRTHEFVSTYELSQEMYANRTGIESAAPGHSIEDDFFDWAWNDRLMTVLVEKKIVGFLFMFVVFLHIDRQMLSQDAESVNLRRYFPDYSRFWVWLGILANGLNGMVVGFISAQFFESADTIMELIVESLALLFLMNLDDLSGGINFGVSEAVFADVIEKFREDWYEDFCAQQHCKHANRQANKQTGERLGDYTSYHDQDDSDKFDESDALELDDHLTGMSLVLCFCRAVNLLLFVIEVPLYLTVSARSEIPDASRGVRRLVPSFFLLVDTFHHWGLWCFLLLLLSWTVNIGGFYMSDRSRRSLDRIQIEKKDCLGFISKVLLRRPDPRWQNRVAFEVATQLVSKKFP